MPTSVDLAEEELVLAIESSIPPQSNPMTTGPLPSPWIARIPKEAKAASVKDSVTSGLPARGHREDVEGSG